MSRLSIKKKVYASAGYNCWLGYHKLENPQLIKEYTKWSTEVVSTQNSNIISNALTELTNGIKGIVGVNPIVSNDPVKASYILIGIFGEGPALDSFIGTEERDKVGEEGFLIKLIKDDIMIIAGATEKGLLYGVFSLLRLMQTETEIANISRIENPNNQLRIINHWDNIDGSVERGYAGSSIFFKNNKIIKNLDRIRDYARLLASVGINGIVINNVNVHKSETKLITDKYMLEVAKLAEVFRSYGIKTYLSVNFASPIELGNLSTADPMDNEVCEWWSNKVEEIYSYIPDLGGFLVKADSEFRPGPFTYGRSHADGANMLAQPLESHGGIVIWRCFVYNCLQDWRDYTIDRAKSAYDNFMPLDGKLNKNVLLQIKNGPMDFQVREPVSPLFGGLQKTNQTLEFQITQEYTGQQKHLCYLVPMWKEILDFDTYAKGKGTSVKKIIGGSVFKNKLGGIVAVANIGDDLNWTGFQMAQANFYGFARLAWNTELTAEEITEEWVKMTYSNDRKIVDIIKEMLLGSWRIYENYTSPLGIGWMVNPNHHFGPNVDGYEYARWGTYHRADSKGIGIDRTVESGTGYTGQYHKEVAEIYEKLSTCPQELLLFFHYVPYDYQLKSGVTLIQHIYNTHFEGVEQVLELKNKWLSLRGMVSEEIFKHVLERLEGQLEYAKEWRDVINTYFYRKTGITDELGRKIY
ncbi:MAG: alpha-glucuronidase family glycosyl hydrolase [Ruminiclostridium sp.]